MLLEADGLLYIAVQRPLHRQRISKFVETMSTAEMDYSSDPHQPPKKKIVEEVRTLFPQSWLWASEAEDGYVSELYWDIIAFGVNCFVTTAS